MHALETRPDEYRDLVEQVLSGDEHAATQLFGDLAKMVRRMASQMLGMRRDELIEDVEQDVMLRVFRTLHHFDPNKGVRFTTWALTYCRNLCIDAMRRRRPSALDSDELGTITAPPAKDGESPLQVTITNELGRDVEAAIDELDESTKRIYKMKVEVGMDHRSIASLTGVAPGTTKTRLFRARQKLRQRLAKWDPRGNSDLPDFTPAPSN